MSHLNPREASAIIYYRYTMRLSISHISKLIERSSRTVFQVLSKNSYVHKLFDKRKMHPYTKRMGEWWFNRKEGALSWFFELWKEGIIGNIHLLKGEVAEGKPP